MPYEIMQSGDRYCVHKQGEQEPIDGGCHDTEQQAKDHMAALYASEPDAAKMLGDNADLVAVLFRALVAQKAGQRHNAADQKLLNAMHDMSVDLGAECMVAPQKTQHIAQTRAEPDMALAFAGPVKAVGPRTVRGPGIVYGGQDLAGDTFTAETDTGAARSFVGMPVYYDHGMSSVKSQVGHVSAYEITDDGIDFEVELDKRKSYLDALMRLVHEQALGLSTGALGHLVVRSNGKLKRWIIGELSLTPTPAEPRTSVQFVKMLLDEPPATDETVVLIA